MCRVNGQGWSVEAGGHGCMEAGTVAQAGTGAPDAICGASGALRVV